MSRRFGDLWALAFSDLRRGRGDSPEVGPGSELGSLIATIGIVALLFAAAWQVAVAFVSFSVAGGDGPRLAVAATAIGVVALLAIEHHGLAPVVPAAMASTGLWMYVLGGDTNSVVAFAGSWQINFASFVAGLVVLGAAAVPIVAVGAAIVSAGILWSLPTWGAGFALLVLITQLSIIVALRWGMLTLTRAASATDELEAAVARSTSRRRVTEHVSAQVAEESRVLHDTAINTLGAIAHGGAGTADTERVRAQCRRDVAFLTGLRGGPLPPMSSSLLDVFQQPGLPIRRLGAPDGELRRWDAALQGSVRDAIVACVREAVTNATKHSGADHVEVDVRASDVLLTVEVRDSGVGFRAGSTNGFGISRSILGRATQQGFRASVESDPGSGTVVTLEVPAAPPRQVPTNGDESVTVDLLGTRAARLWGLGVALVSIALFCAGSVNEHAALYPMIGLMLCVRALNVGVPGFGSSRVNLVVLAVVPSAVYALAAAATGFGSVSANHWHALAPTGPFVLLLAVTTSVVRRSVAAGAWIVTSLVLAARAGATSAGSAHVVLVAAGVGLAFTGVWVVFQRLLRHLGRQSFEARKELAALDRRAQLDAANQGGACGSGWPRAWTRPSSCWTRSPPVSGPWGPRRRGMRARRRSGTSGRSCR
ncbi:hypothetical protein F8O01_01180 [Pseudoclavibacter chungangensis]|uniref:Histidine kinase/HSP90-like ATPase domain-containing protein n=1 Tax=Pseudoclavibacter chungangensis TaxID=587635 RepID=A0A7J5C251_9MICO|nr:ATP-binding protein [Pseudoclavibacter chungangensis]KAB1662585.1 hypothetical protein F8O01_01180 [Pseudoclavibacter chungangensis]NYJ68633.1 signal transduction histidine kinase [Pseudoclavibacter chungangensis]